MIKIIGITVLSLFMLGCASMNPQIPDMACCTESAQTDGEVIIRAQEEDDNFDISPYLIGAAAIIIAGFALSN